MLEFTRRLMAFRRDEPVLRRRRFFQGRRIRGSDVKDLTWFRPDGDEITDADWGDHTARALALRLAGDAIDEPDEFGHRILGDTLLMLLNARDVTVQFKLPRIALKSGAKWQILLDTATGWLDDGPVYDGGATVTVCDRATVLLKRVVNGDGTMSV